MANEERRDPNLWGRASLCVCAGVLVAQQHAQRRVDGDDEREELADGVAGGVDDHEQVAHAVVVAQLLEGPVGAVGDNRNCKYVNSHVKRVQLRGRVAGICR